MKSLFHGLKLIPSSWCAQWPRGRWRSSLLTIQTVCTMGDRLLNYGLPGIVNSSSHCSVLTWFCANSQTYSSLYRPCCFPPEVFFATKYNETSTRLYASELSARTETAQFTITHSQIKTLYFFPRETLISSSSCINVTEVFLYTIGVSERPWLFRSPRPFSVSWHGEAATPLILRAKKLRKWCTVVRWQSSCWHESNGPPAIDTWKIMFVCVKCCMFV